MGSTFYVTPCFRIRSQVPWEEQMINKICKHYEHTCKWGATEWGHMEKLSVNCQLIYATLAQRQERSRKWPPLSSTAVLGHVSSRIWWRTRAVLLQHLAEFSVALLHWAFQTFQRKLTLFATVVSLRLTSTWFYCWGRWDFSSLFV